MKIVHLCLGCFYIDNHSYQENLLPKYHKKMGHDVSIVASRVSFDENGDSCLVDSGRYLNEHSIPVTRLNYVKGASISQFMRLYNGTYETLVKEKPDLIFIHGCQFYDMREVVKYIKNNRSTQVFVDNHADFSNSATNWLSKNILHKIIWRYCASIIEPYTKMFYGVLPARRDFLLNIYKLPSKKVDFLPMGADDEKVILAQNEFSKKKIREKHNINDDDFLIITGGKIDNAKRQILLLMSAIHRINKDNVKLIVFGSIIEELKDEINKLVDGNKVQYIGWINSEDSYQYFAAADLCIFPGRHSVLWEQAVGTGTPCLFKYWEGTTHIDINGNCEFLYQDSIEEITEKIEEIINDESRYNKMKDIATSSGRQKFLYSNIAEKSINMDKE